MAAPLYDEIAKRSIDLYDSLPRHGKPRVRDNGVPEWTILATISIIRDGQIIPISLGAGVKVLPATRLPPCGDTLHDCHAEILARRGFVRWMIEESRLIITQQEHMGVLELTPMGKIRWKRDAQVWLYVSALPCGDASTLHTAAHQPPDMAFLKSSADGHTPRSVEGQAIRGRNGYDSFGSIRTKPGRTDSNPTICMSCSDKIASWNVVGMQGALFSYLLEEPIYLDGIVIGGVEEVPPDTVELDEGVSWWDRIRSEVERSLYGRLEGIEDKLKTPYKLNRPSVYLSNVPFSLSKPEVALRYPNAPDPVPNVQCILHIPRLETMEVLHNGCKSGGSWNAPGNALISNKARSGVCKYEIFKSCLALEGDLRNLNTGASEGGETRQTLFDYKHPPDSTYQRAKAILRGIPGPPAVLRDFEACGTFSVTSASGSGGAEGEAPFAGWIVSGERWESFAVDGAVELPSACADP